MTHVHQLAMCQYQYSCSIEKFFQILIIERATGVDGGMGLEANDDEVIKALKEIVSMRNDFYTVYCHLFSALQEPH